MNNQSLKNIPPYRKLQNHWHKLQSQTISGLFQQDLHRFEHFSAQACGIHLDYSKNLLTAETVKHLIELADARGLVPAIKAMFAGDPINNTEQRAVLHTLLRRPIKEHTSQSHELAVAAELKKMAALCERFESGHWRGYSGKPLRHVVVIGIGGSYLGPKLVCEALSAQHQTAAHVHFIANVDAHELTDVLSSVPADQTLVVVISKSFTTQETSVNAQTAARWLRDAAQTDTVMAQQFVAVSSNLEAVHQFGIPDEHILTMWDWVGGRFSLWSTVGFPIALQIGFSGFRQLLSGAYAMDCHFTSANLDQNLPVLLAMIGIWNINIMGLPHYAVLPYDYRLRSLPSYLQQLDMESNGKSVTKSGLATDYHTGPVLFGEAGTNGQHAFYQLIHQGTSVIPCDFIGSANADHGYPNHHSILLANMVAQSQALMQGRDLEQTRALLNRKKYSPEEVDLLAPHMTFAGNRPSNTLVINALTPQTLGALLALYEHKIFVQGTIWGINSFDQMGVELGKTLAATILPGLEQDTSNADFDSSTRGLIALLKTASRP